MPDQNNSRVTSQVDESLSILNSLSAGEVEMAKKHGYFKDADTTKKLVRKVKMEMKMKKVTVKPVKAKKTTMKKVSKKMAAKKKELLDKKPLHSTDLDDKFDRMDADPSVEHEELSKFTAEQKSFFWKWKKDKKKRQEAEAKAELLQLQLKQASAQKIILKI